MHRKADDPSGDVPVVLAHGFTGSSASWPAAILEGLTSTGRRAVAVDLPGHGAPSGKEGPGAVTLEAALAVLGSATTGRMDLVAYSMGGRIALHFAARFPERVRRLVLESASPGLERAPERAARRAEDEALALRIERHGVAAFVADWSSRPVIRSARSRPPELEEHVRRVRSANSAEGLAGALRGLGTGSLPSLWATLHEVRSPTLLLMGSEDPKFVEIGRRMAEKIPDAVLDVVPGAGHTVHLDRPQEWLDRVRRHLVER
jgi:2-succinyl-6-hydroxy-2,4-cyclohexadiene-1-carboxylate synthase